MPSSVHRDDNATVVTIDDTLFANNRLEFRQLVLDEIAHGSRNVRVDCQRAIYMDNSGLGVLVSLAKTIRERGGDVHVANLNDDLRTLFELTKLDTNLCGRLQPGRRASFAA